MILSKRIDLSSQKFGRLTVLSLVHKDEKHKLYWKCICDCGVLVIVRGDRLKNGTTKSCGCFNHEAIKQRAFEKSIKGKVKEERLYNIWSSMKQRCYDRNSCEYNRYGARGINVCEEWLKDYKSFKEWALKNGYSDKLSIDRIDVNGNYEPNNCKWSTPKEQANNRRNSLRLTYKGKTQTLAEWSEELEINYSCLYRRIKSGWTTEKAFAKTKTNLKEIN